MRALLIVLGVVIAVVWAVVVGSAARADTYSDQLVALINEQRAQNGLPAYRNDARLAAAAGNHNLFMNQNNCFAHICAGEADPMQRMRSAGYPLMSGGENIGMGYQSPQEMVTGWMNSPGHRAAILAQGWTDVGCAYLRVGQAWDTYWTCDFAAGDSRGPGPGPAPTATATPGRGATPPAGWVFRIELQPSAGWALWDNAYYTLCNQAGVTCSWYRR